MDFKPIVQQIWAIVKLWLMKHMQFS